MSVLALSNHLRRFADDQNGVSAVEFAMLLPLMLTLYLGGVEVSQAVAVDRKVTLTARAVADLAAQSTTINNAEMANILNAASSVATPYPVSNLKVTVSSVSIDAQGKAKVAWSDGLNASPRPVNQVVTLPAALAIPNSTLIWGEVKYTYTPTIGYVVTGSMTLADQIYMRPRLTNAVTRSNS